MTNENQSKKENLPTSENQDQDPKTEINSTNENSVQAKTEKRKLTKAEKKKINDDYYKNNREDLLAKRKAKRLEKQTKLNQMIDDPSSTKDILTQEDQKLFDSIPIQKVDPINYLEKQIHKYIFPKNVERVLRSYQDSKVSSGLVLIGHAGTGKTEMVKNFSIKNNIPLVMTSINDDIRSTDLLGSFSLTEGSSMFLLGDLPKAVEIANNPNNKTKTCIVLLDELNTASNNVQKIFNNNLNFKSGIRIPLINKIYRLNPDSKIIVVATMNYSSYSGTYPLNLELNSKFDFLEVGIMPDKLQKDLLKKQNIDDQTIESLLITQKELMKAFESDNIEQPIDPRGLLKFAEKYNQFIQIGLEKDEAIKESINLSIVGRYLDNKNDLKFVKEIIESNFGRS